MKTFEVLTNIQNWDGYEFKGYPLKREEADVCIEVLKKNLPSQVAAPDAGDVVCPACGVKMIDIKKYCCNCGQALTKGDNT